jgi:UDP-N-acetylglucosamine 2-epimerase (non-hydrolysing)
VRFGRTPHILHVVGARPNFMKVSPVMKSLASHPEIRQTLVHTGQHYDVNMSRVFFRDLDLEEPSVNLGVGSDTHGQQTAAIMRGLEPFVLEAKPDLVLVYGDVNSTLAAALVAAKIGIAVGHVEAGLRSFDRTMPEEINRMLTDQMAELLFTPSADADENLLREGIPPEGIHRVGNVMIDTMVMLLRKASDSADVLRAVAARAGKEMPIHGERFGLVTLHRPSNVDEAPVFGAVLDALVEISRRVPLVFPIHPRTRRRLPAFHTLPAGAQFYVVDPLGYLDFLALERSATLVITDSGGIQEECTYLGVPCLTVRENTERPITVTLGTNILVGRDMRRLVAEAHRILGGDVKRGGVPPLWDGHAADRIVDAIMNAPLRERG